MWVWMGVELCGEDTLPFLVGLLDDNQKKFSKTSLGETQEFICHI